MVDSAHLRRLLRRSRGIGGQRPSQARRRRVPTLPSDIPAGRYER
ncbi:hypothetical protein STAFG_4956 [Streptomyces afghaniensis 772]|uniref:Uncharacterized protein n=1 Tax=Streptomyces afghaniensis 772 TaxID=1283301 RepID=S4MQS7_9ACTN|nr:hypothetical protein STAFG_4956 [Streptomyces afghaniensis 772]